MCLRSRSSALGRRPAEGERPLRRRRRLRLWRPPLARPLRTGQLASIVGRPRPFSSLCRRRSLCVRQCRPAAARSAALTPPASANLHCCGNNPRARPLDMSRPLATARPEPEVAAGNANPKRDYQPYWRPSRVLATWPPSRPLGGHFARRHPDATFGFRLCLLAQRRLKSSCGRRPVRLRLRQPERAGPLIMALIWTPRFKIVASGANRRRVARSGARRPRAPLAQPAPGPLTDGGRSLSARQLGELRGNPIRRAARRL